MKDRRWHIGALIFTRSRIFFAIVICLCAFWFWTCVPSPLFEDPYSTVILDRDGGLLGATIADDEQWRFPPGASVPSRFALALTTFEDQRFYQHPGVDPLALARAMWQNVSSRRVVSGASTITMQVIRLSRRGQPRTIGEKLLEMAMALRLELSADKEQVLSLYSSHAPFGGNVVGLEAAAWRYFGRRPEQLSWAEAAMLAVLPNSPALIHPGRNREALLNKRDRLIGRLWRQGVIDSLSCVLARMEPLPLRPRPLPGTAPHLLARHKAETQRRVRADGSARTAATVASRLRSTLDGNIQRRASRVVAQHLEQLAGNGVHNAAVLILDVPTGTVVAYVGNAWDSVSGDHHHHVDVITSPRSTGSILKPLLYGGMMQAGELLPEELVADVPVRIADFAPENYSRTYQGAVPASMALARSLNIPAVRMLHSYGASRFYSLLTRLGMSTLHRNANDYGLSLILGGAEGTLWDLTGIYAGMARSVNNHFTPETADTRVFFSPKYDTLSGIRPNDILSTSSMTNDSPLGAAACWLTLKAMLEVTRPDEESAWREFTSSRRVAWKTATSQGFRDGWAIGVTPHHAIGVWVGNADGEGRPGLTGLSAAAPILFDLFGLLPPSDWFECPESRLVQIDVCAQSGCRAGPDCATTVATLVPPAGLHNSSCPYCRLVHCDSTLAWRVSTECERLADLRSVPWFVLPPAMEWYYRESHADYRPLPPFRPDCIESGSDNRSRPMAVIYPGRKGKIYVPAELDGARGRTVFEAAHRDPRTTIYWHLDGDYLGSTVDIHQMLLAPKPGEHRLVLVDEDGERSERLFTVLTKDRRH